MFWKLQTIPQEYIPPCKVFLYFLHRSKEQHYMKTQILTK